MDELENRDGLDIEQEAPQEAQEAPVTAETGRGEETDPQEPEAAQEPAEGQENGIQEDAAAEPQEAPQEEPAAEDTQPEAPPEDAQEPSTEQEAPQEAQEAPVTAETGRGEETDTQEPEAAQEPAESQENGSQEEPAAQQPAAQAEGDTRPILGGGRQGLGTGLVTPAVITPAPTLLATENAAADAQETDEEYSAIPVNELDVVKLGRQGEHLTQQVQIDCSAWLGSGSPLTGCQLLIAAIRPGESTIYLPTVTVEDGVITWDIQDQDTAKGGWGRGEVRAMKDVKIKKSVVFRTRVEPSLEGSGSTPPTPPDWVQEILTSVAAAQAAAEAAAASAAQAELNTRGLAGWSLTVETDETVTIDYTEPTT